MDKDKIKGKMKDIGGRVQRQTGEWTGDEEQQIKGAGKQAEGKIQNVAGKMKDKARDMEDKVRAERDRAEHREGRKRVA